MHFIYQPVREDEIRLVTLEPGDDPASTIQCSLEHVSLDNISRHPPGRRFKGDNYFWPETRDPLETAAIFKKGVKPEAHDAIQPTRTGTLGTKDDQDLPWRSDWGDYMALSYFWGSVEPKRHILLNGLQFPVTSNLWDALAQLRQSHRVRQGFKLWIDAICINQQDVAERNHQVSLMRDIYASAWQVVVWLGGEADDSDLAIITLRWLASVVRDRPSMTTFYREKKQIDARPFFIKWATYESPLRKDVNKALFHLFTRPYWRRMWILQEVAMARPDSPVLCGSKCMAWQDIYESARYITQDEARFGRDIAHSARPRVLPTWTFEFARSRVVDERQWASERTWELLVEIAKVQIKQKQQRNLKLTADILKPLLLSREAKVTEEKDKVYGVLGIKEIADRVTIEPDYNLSLADIYKDFTAKLLVDGDLDVLRLASTGTALVRGDWRFEDVQLPSALNHSYVTPIVGPLMSMLKSSDKTIAVGAECTHNMPSWAICWSCEPAPTAQLFGLYEAGGSASSAAAPVIVDTCLVVKGRIIDTLTSLSSCHHAEIDVNYPFNASKTSHSLYGDLEATRAALWKTIVADTTAEGGRNAPETHSWILDPRLWDQGVAGVYTNGFGLAQLMARNKGLVLCGYTLEELIFEPSKIAGWRKAMRKDQFYNPTKEQCEALSWAMNTMAWRRLVGTKAGRIGLAPATAVADDAVAILAGCSTPMILREFADGWKIVGESYVHGVMSGEMTGNLGEFGDVKVY